MNILEEVRKAIEIEEEIDRIERDIDLTEMALDILEASDRF